MIDPVLIACALPMLSASAHVAFSGWVRSRYPARGGFLLVHGGNQHARVSGAGPAVALVHGAGGVHQDFTDALVDSLAQHHTVLAMDRPGHGHSERIADLRGLDAHAAALSALLHARANGPAVVVGHSYGALVALRVALDQPALVRALVAVTPLFDPGAPHQRWGALAALPALAWLAAWTCTLPVALTTGSGVRRDAWHPQQPPRGVTPSRLFALRPPQVLTAADDLNRVGRDLARLRAELPHLAVPVSIIAAEQDRITPSQTNAVPMHQAIPGSRLVRAPNAGHWLMRVTPHIIVEEAERYSSTRAGAPELPTQ